MEQDILLLQLESLLEAWLEQLNQMIVGPDPDGAARATAAKSQVLQLMIRLEQRRREGANLDDKATYVLENLLPSLLGTLPAGTRANLDERVRLIRQNITAEEVARKSSASERQATGNQALVKQALDEIALEVATAAEARIAEAQADRDAALAERDEALGQTRRAEARAAKAELARDAALAERDAALDRLRKEEREHERDEQAAKPPPSAKKNKTPPKSSSGEGAAQETEV
jgi:hypothetical protein